jgi:hypothetical protein
MLFAQSETAVRSRHLRSPSAASPLQPRTARNAHPGEVLAVAPCPVRRPPIATPALLRVVLRPATGRSIGGCFTPAAEHVEVGRGWVSRPNGQRTRSGRPSRRLDASVAWPWARARLEKGCVGRGIGCGTVARAGAGHRVRRSAAPRPRKPTGERRQRRRTSPRGRDADVGVKAALAEIQRVLDAPLAGLMESDEDQAHAEQLTREARAVPAIGQAREARGVRRRSTSRDAGRQPHGP